MTPLRYALLTRRPVTAALAIAAGLALLVLVLDVLVVPSLMTLSERVLGYGLGIERILRIHFAYASWILLLVLLVCLYVWPVGDPRVRLVLSVLGIAILIPLAVWVLDGNAAFESEGSAVTFFSALVLILTSLVAFTNAYPFKFLPDVSRLARTFWTLTGLAFLAAGMDEFFVLHERVAMILEPLGLRIGLSFGIVQDLVTISYAAGSVIFVIIFRNYFFRKMLGAGFMSGWIFLAGIATFALAVFNDSADLVVEWFFPYVDPHHAMNFAEEVFEFTAANLFLSSFCVAFMERIGPGALVRAGNEARSVTLSIVSLVLLVGTLLVSAVVAVAFRPSSPGIIAQGDYEFSVFADATDGLDEANQLVFKTGLGLLVGNERSSNVLRFDARGEAQILVDSKTGLVDPDGLAVGNGSIYVVDDGGRQVLEYSRDGSLIGRLGTAWVSPKGVAVDSHGVLYVADRALRVIVRIGGGNSRMIASALDGLVVPEQLTFDDRGNLYVTDRVAQAVFRISPEGKLEEFITAEQGIQCPEAIVFHRSHLYIADRCAVAVHRFALDGSGGPFIQFTHGYRGLAGIAFDDRGVLYVAVGSAYRPHNLILQIRGIE